MPATPATGAHRHVDHVGSLVRPPELMEAWFAAEAGTLSTEALAEVTDRCVREAVALQEGLGLEFITDGEFRRGGWSRGFLDAVEGFGFKPSALVFQNEDGVKTPAPAPVATRRMKRKRNIVADDFAFLKSVAKKTPKVTMPTPSHMHFGHFGQAADRTVYPDMDAYWDDMIAIYREEIADLAAAGCTLLQLDEVPLTLCCDETNRGVARQAGEDPDMLIDLYIDAVNRAIAGKPADMRVIMHLCRGNMQGLWMGDGGYAPIAEKLFNECHVDGFLLEYDSPRAGDFAPLAAVPEGKRVYLGLVSTKKPEVESADLLKRRLDEASRYAPLERLGLCPQCGFGSSAMSKFNVLPNPMTLDLERAKLARLTEVAQDVWG
jgi:5-methyltetrahydropteroyltriglutamate--homocysteine methyltransferase